ncbi:transposase [Pirellulaceae bacterium SH467]
MARHRLTDLQWGCIGKLFPSPKSTGRPPTDCRKAFDAIRCILRTESPWRDLPEEFGKWRTIYGLYDKWNGDGTLDAVLNKLRSARIDDGAIENELWCVDGSVVRAHRCASGGGKKGSRRAN